METLLEFIDDIQRYKERQDLPTRTQAKLAKEVVPSKNLVESPLSVLVEILKSESRLQDMRETVISAGVEVITKIFASSNTSLLSIFGNPSETEDNPGYIKPKTIPRGAIEAYIRSHGEEFVATHLPK